MARPRKRKTLGVWMNGLQVGAWSQAPNGEHEFSYSSGWLSRSDARPLSLSMPLRAGAPYRGAIVEDWFDNLLPDNREIRQRMRSRFHASSTRPFDLLAEIGRDCVGAVQLLPAGEAPGDVRAIRGQALADPEIAAMLRATTVAGSGGDVDDFRISIAGAQEKTALLRHEGRWQRPLGATPTTHIFKLPLGKVGNFQGDLSTSVENEWLCSRIVAAYGLPIARTGIGVFEDQKALIVERFDRRLAADGSHWLRLPQEDLCQALEAPPSLKYESDGGPGIRPIMDLLLGSRLADTDRGMFLEAQIVFWLLCAPDGHAKNFSVFIEPEGRFRLTPLYDVVSAWPIVGHGANRLPLEKARMAMAATSGNRHYRWKEIRPRHWLSTAQECGVDPAAMQGIMDRLVASTPQVVARIAETLPAAFPASVSEPILRGLETGARRLSTSNG